MTLILKHANKSRPGNIDWGPNDFDVLNADRASVEYSCHRRRRKGARGSGRSLLASIRRRSTAAAIHRHAKKRCRISKRSGKRNSQLNNVNALCRKSAVTAAKKQMVISCRCPLPYRQNQAVRSS